MGTSTSAILQVTTPALGVPPSPATGLTTSLVTTTSLTLTWAAPGTGDLPFSYQPQISTDGVNWTNISVAPVTLLTVPVTGLTPATPYQFRVITSNVSGSSTSTSLSATTLAVAPGAPTAIAVVGTPGTNDITISWLPPATGTAPFTYNTFFRTPSGSGAFTAGPTTSGLSVDITGLVAGSFYDFEVTATNSAGTSVASAILSNVATSSGAIPPSAPSNISSGTLTPQSIQIDWTASSVGTAPIEYSLAWRPSSPTTTPTFFDDFTSLNTAVWILGDQPGSGKIVGGYQTNTTWIEDTNAQGCYAQAGSVVNLTLIAGTGGGTSTCRGARMATEGTFSQLYGYFECAVNAMAFVNATGFAWWLFADNEGAIYQEIDIIEIAFSSSSNYDAKASLWNTNQTLTDGIDNFHLDLTVPHTFGVDWQPGPGGVKFYIDRVLSGQFDEPGYVQPMFMLLELTGNDFSNNVNPANLPIHVPVDKVTVWQTRPF